jgi:hypothetical protein
MDQPHHLKDYEEAEVAAARSVMLELFRILGHYRRDLLIVGGWIPSLILPKPADPAERHCGSLDVDLALDHRNLGETGYESIHQLLVEHGYKQGGDQPFQYSRRVGEFTIRVDLLAGEYGGTGKGRRTQKVQDVRPRKARGCDLAFEVAAVTVELSGELPGGTLDHVKIPVASAVPFLVMKAIAMNDRLKPKDAYDLWYLITYFPGGIEELAKAIRPYLNHGLVNEALGILSDKFESVDHVGPRHAADFDGNLDPEFRAQRQRDAFERVQNLLGRLKGGE